jgi:hypothetical protein
VLQWYEHVVLRRTIEQVVASFGPCLERSENRGRRPAGRWMWIPMQTVVRTSSSYMQINTSVHALRVGGASRLETSISSQVETVTVSLVVRHSDQPSSSTGGSSSIYRQGKANESSGGRQPPRRRRRRRGHMPKATAPDL